MPHPIEIAGVEEGDALVQRLMDGRDALGAVRRPVHVGHSHGPEADGGYFRALGAELLSVHLMSSMKAAACRMATICCRLRANPSGEPG